MSPSSPAVASGGSVCYRNDVHLGRSPAKLVSSRWKYGSARAIGEMRRAMTFDAPGDSASSRRGTITTRATFAAIRCSQRAAFSPAGADRRQGLDGRNGHAGQRRPRRQRTGEQTTHVAGVGGRYFPSSRDIRTPCPAGRGRSRPLASSAAARWRMRCSACGVERGGDMRPVAGEVSQHSAEFAAPSGFCSPTASRVTGAAAVPGRRVAVTGNEADGGQRVHREVPCQARSAPRAPAR